VLQATPELLEGLPRFVSHVINTRLKHVNASLVEGPVKPGQVRSLACRGAAGFGRF